MTRTRSITKLTAVFVTTAVLGAVLAAAVGGRPSVGGAADASPSAVVMGDPRYPYHVAEDWAAVADHLVAVTVTGSRDIPAPAEERANGEWITLRALDARVLEVLWSRRGASQMPDTFSWTALGFSHQGEFVTPMDFYGTPRVRVGSTYLMPVVKRVDAPGAPTWSPLALEAVYGYDDGTIAQGVPGQVSWADEYVGRSGVALAERLTAAARSLPFDPAQFDDPVVRTRVWNEARPEPEAGTNPEP